jgi:hypothetical protein
MAATKNCRLCKKFKPLSAYGPCKRAVDRHSYDCRECTAKRMAKHYTPEQRRTRYTKEQFGLPAEVVDAFVKSRTVNGLICEACGKLCDVLGEVRTKGKLRLVVDHDHKTRKLRGVLCDGCNTALGKLGDNEEGVRALLVYIECKK